MNIKQHLPNLVTLVNLALGCISIVLAFEGHLFWVPYFVIAAAFADFSDGLLARALKVSSPLGLQLDSLADMVTFGVVPGITIFHLLKLAIGPNALWWQFLPALMLTLFSALRLAKFNIDTRQTEGFIGVPTPTCTMFIISLVLIVKNNQAGLAGFILNPVFLSITAIVFSFLLVAELPMMAFKVKKLTWKGNELPLVLLFSGILAMVIWGGLGIALSILLYIAFSVIQKLKRMAFVLLLLVLPLLLPAQDLPYAKQVIDTLCSAQMAGRGYANQGDRKAARYIAAQFTRWGAQPFGNNYFQHFNIDANVFPDKMEMSVNQKTLIPGIDFIIHPASTGLEGTYKVLRIKEKWLLSDKKFEELLSETYEGKVLWLDYPSKNAKTLQGKLGILQSAAKAAAYISPEDKKLTWHISGQPKYQTEITVLRSQIPRKFKTATFNIDNAYLSNYQTQNVVAYIKGTQQPDSFFVFTAHYDHIGQMGSKQYVPGANDNAAGIAMLLNLMQYYTQNPPTASVVFIAFGAEELGLLGSKYYTENPLFPLQNIRFLINLDLVGTGDEGLMAVNATEFPDAYNLLQQLNTQYNYLPAIKSRPPAANSDQHWFYQNGVPCFFLYTMGGIQAYHDVFDRPETLPLTKFTNLCTLLTQFAQQYKK